MANLRNLPLSHRPIRRFTALYVGLSLYGAAMSLMIAANLGLDPWDVFHQGISQIIGVRFGWVVIAVGVVVLLLWIPLRQMPSIGTVSNVIVIGFVVNGVSAVLPVPTSLAVRWAYAIVGVLATGVASGLYIGARLGPGPRDGLMTGLVMRFPGRRFVSIRVIRTGIEASVLLIGWVLGGQVGWLTLIYAVSIGPLAHVMIPLLTVPDPQNRLTENRLTENRPAQNRPAQDRPTQDNPARSRVPQPRGGESDRQSGTDWPVLTDPVAHVERVEAV
jgi:uncharacterized membrane protein YczE